jgi:putative membrane protein
MRLFSVNAVAAAIVTLSASIGVGAADNSPTVVAQATMGAASAGGQVGGEANRASGSTGGDRNAGLNSKESGTEKLARADRRFIEKAAMGGMLEVELGKLAQSKGAAASVKSFGGRMVEDHGKANQELMAIAGKLGVQPPQMDRSHQREVEQLSKLSGAEFDKRYMKAMVSHHKKDVSDFEKASKSAKQAELKSFAADKLPTLREHLKLAQTTEAEVRATKSPS